LAVDTTVTDARLIHRAIEKLVELAKREDVELRQGYLRLAKRICFRLHGRVPLLFISLGDRRFAAIL
jgi:ribosomal protein L17